MNEKAMPVVHQFESEESADADRAVRGARMASHRGNAMKITVTEKHLNAAVEAGRLASESG